MPFLAKYDGKCCVCGGKILGRITSGDNAAHQITWPRRSANGGAPVRGKVQHVSPTCDEVAAGIMLRSEMRSGASSPDAATISTPTPNPPETVNRIASALEKAGIPVDNSAVSAVVAGVAAIATKVKNLVKSSAHWAELFLALLQCGTKRIALVGPPGTGKSTTSMLLMAGATGKRVHRITMTEGTGIEDLLGMFQLTKDGEATVTRWVDGPAALALRNGEPLLVDEFTHTPPEIESLLYALADDKPHVMLPNGEFLEANEGYLFAGTTNDNVSSLQPALLDRMEAVLLATTPHPDALGGLSAASKALCMNYYRSLDVSGWKFNRPPQVRPVRSFERIRAAGIMEDAAIAKVVFGDSGNEFLSALSTAGATGRR